MLHRPKTMSGLPSSADMVRCTIRFAENPRIDTYILCRVSDKVQERVAKTGR
jgi:hypothetical protein